MTPLTQFPFDVHPIVIVDWIEFSAVCSKRSETIFAEVSRLWDVRRNNQDEDFEGGTNKTQDNFMEEIKTEIMRRIDSLGESYPFNLTDEEEFILKEDPSIGGLTYLFCLFLSHPSQDEVLNGSILPAIDNNTRDYFQVCSTLAAAGFVDGNAVSFGFPRIDHSDFLVKLKEVYQKFGEGKVRSAPLRGTTPAVKDDGVDIIAWKNSNDGVAGKSYLLGQVASGKNWQEKSILGTIPPFHQTWFEQIPPSTPTPAMFIPFQPLPVGAGDIKETFDILTYGFGTILYRLRIPNYIEKGMQNSRIQALLVERTDDFDKIETWVEETRTLFKESLS